MAVNIQAPRGVRDILPADSYKWQYLEKNMREICRHYRRRSKRNVYF